MIIIQRGATREARRARREAQGWKSYLSRQGSEANSREEIGKRPGKALGIAFEINDLFLHISVTLTISQSVALPFVHHVFSSMRSIHHKFLTDKDLQLSF